MTKIEAALIGVLNGTYLWSDLSADTGMTKERCEEILALRDSIIVEQHGWIQKPTVPGWYWFEHDSRYEDKKRHRDICQIRQLDIDLWEKVKHPDNMVVYGPLPEPPECAGSP